MDALNTGTGLLQQQPTNYRRIILLLSQSYDSGSKTRFEDLSRRLVESGITIYSLAFSSEVMIGASQRTKSTKRAPAELAMLSGGEEIQFHDENDLERGLTLVSDDISKGYGLSFYPSSHDVGLHTIAVSVVNSTEPFAGCDTRTTYWSGGSKESQ